MKKLMGVVLVGALSVVTAVHAAKADDTPFGDLQQKAIQFGKQLIGGGDDTENQNSDTEVTSSENEQPEMPESPEVEATDSETEGTSSVNDVSKIIDFYNNWTPPADSTTGPGQMLIAPNPMAVPHMSAEALQEKEQELSDEEAKLKVQFASTTGVIVSGASSTIPVTSLIRERHNLEAQRVVSVQEAVAAKQSEYEDAVAQNAATAKTSLQDIQDKTKQQLAANIVDNLYAVQKRMLDHFISVLDKLGVVLTNISTRTDKAVMAGVITKDQASGIYNAITAARNSITSTRNDVLAAYGAVAEPSIPGNATIQGVQNALKSMRDTIKTNLLKLENGVKSDFGAVQNIAVQLAQIPRVDEANASSSDGETTSSSDTNNQ